MQPTTPTTHAARWIVPVVGPPIEGGCVVTVGGKIAAVGPRRAAVGKIIDYGDAILAPGLVNAHAHLEFSTLERPLGAAGMAFHDWIREVLTYRRSTAFDAQAAVLQGLAESIACGVTTLGDIASMAPRQLFESPPREALVVAFGEMIGLTASRAAAQTERLGAFSQFIDGPNIRRGLSPHAPYTVRNELLDAAVAASTIMRIPLAFHLAESREELQLLSSGDGPLVDYMRELGVWDETAIPRGTRPLDYLQKLSTAHRALVIHGNYLTDDEIAYLAGHADRMTVVYCPRTHAYFGHEPHPLPKLLAAGASVALGTDGRCTNPDLNLWEELRFVRRTQPQLSPEHILRMAALDAARALGLEQEVGSLAVGKRAALVALGASNVADPFEALLDDESHVVAVVCG